MPSVTGVTKSYGDGTYGGVVVHGTTAGTARPASLLFVHWIGSVTPTNALSGDEWTDTAAMVVKRYNGAAWVLLGNGVYAVSRVGDAASIANSTMVPDTVLAIPNVQPGTYELSGQVIYDSGATTADAKFGWVLPAGSTGTWSLGAPGTTTAASNVNTTTVNASYNAVASSINGGGAGSGIANAVVARPLGALTITTAGTVQLQYAQQATDASNVMTVRAGSFIKLTRLW